MLQRQILVGWRAVNDQLDTTVESDPNAAGFVRATATANLAAAIQLRRELCPGSFLRHRSCAIASLRNDDDATPGRRQLSEVWSESVC
jgi:hypothetical protein